MCAAAGRECGLWIRAAEHDCPQGRRGIGWPPNRDVSNDPPCRPKNSLLRRDACMQMFFSAVRGSIRVQQAWQVGMTCQCAPLAVWVLMVSRAVLEYQEFAASRGEVFLISAVTPPRSACPGMEMIWSAGQSRSPRPCVQ